MVYGLWFMPAGIASSRCHRVLRVYRVQGLGLRVWGLVFRVKGLFGV